MDHKKDSHIDKPPPGLFAKMTAPLGSATYGSDEFGVALRHVADVYVKSECRCRSISPTEDMVHSTVAALLDWFTKSNVLESDFEPAHRVAIIIEYTKKTVRTVVARERHANLTRLEPSDARAPEAFQPLREREIPRSDAVARQIRRAFNRMSSPKKTILQKNLKEGQTFGNLQQQSAKRRGRSLTESALKMQYKRAKENLLEMLLADEDLPKQLKDRLARAAIKKTG